MVVHGLLRSRVGLRRPRRCRYMASAFGMASLRGLFGIPVVSRVAALG
jgi:hypothetical protein